MSSESHDWQPADEARLFRGIRWRLVGWNLLVLGLILAIVGVGVLALVSFRLRVEGDALLQARTEMVRSVAALLARVGDAQTRVRWLHTNTLTEGVFYLVLDRQGRVIANPGNLELDALPNRDALAALATKDSDLRTVRVDQYGLVRLYTVPLGDRLNPQGYLQAGRSLAAEQRMERLLALVLLGAGLAGLGLAAVGGYFLAGRALMPTRQAFRRQQAFVADASHELRTPLTLIRANAEVLGRHPEQTIGENADLVDDIVNETAHLGHLVSDLLTLARADAGQAALSQEPVDLALTIQDAGRRLLPLAEARGQTLDVTANESCLVRGDPGRLHQLVVILLDNALKHGNEGGHIRVTLGAARGQARLTVADDGPGIAPEHLPHLFERFYRVDKARSREQGGAGLGLSIAQWIVQAHRGRIQVTSTPELGTTFTVTLPLVK
ncbi:MAG: histidine kinase [Chloroflexi bacterium]|nr:histidine kinase [Chloroflexota bacterium]MBU1749142.1 histidine kinase [Chloroflexota bacterium]MBU1877937.1 histidine kinase [Chloroflexota bacterium]